MTTWAALNNPPASTSPSQASTGPHQATMTVPTLVPQYKMTGYYAAGSTYETWTSFNYPNTTPPSGHTLTNISYRQIQG
jgi:hypothetical protein